VEIIVTSRQLKASDALDLAFDAKLDRPRVVTIEEWDGSPAYLITHGPLAYRQTTMLRPRMSAEEARCILELAKAAPSTVEAQQQVAALAVDAFEIKPAIPRAGKRKSSITHGD